MISKISPVRTNQSRPNSTRTVGIQAPQSRMQNDSVTFGNIHAKSFEIDILEALCTHPDTKFSRLSPFPRIRPGALFDTIYGRNTLELDYGLLSGNWGTRNSRQVDSGIRLTTRNERGEPSVKTFCLSREYPARPDGIASRDALNARLDEISDLLVAKLPKRPDGEPLNAHQTLEEQGI